MDVTEVDERDSGWEDCAPRFRVYFQTPPASGGAVATYDLTGVDVAQAIAWAQSKAGPETCYSIALVREVSDHDPNGGRGLVWLLGADPSGVPDDPGGAAYERMVKRIATPIEVPAFDRP